MRRPRPATRRGDAMFAHLEVQDRGTIITHALMQDDYHLQSRISDYPIEAGYPETRELSRSTASLMERAEIFRLRPARSTTTPWPCQSHDERTTSGTTMGVPRLRSNPVVVFRSALPAKPASRYWMILGSNAAARRAELRFGPLLSNGIGQQAVTAIG